MNYVAKAAGTDILKMTYQNIGASMTAQYAIVCDNWPLEQFCSPSSLRSHTKLKVLYHAFKTRTACFRKLTEQEFEQWESDRFNAALAQTTAHNDDTISQQAGSDELLAIPTPLQPISGVEAHVHPRIHSGNRQYQGHCYPCIYSGHYYPSALAAAVANTHQYSPPCWPSPDELCQHSHLTWWHRYTSSQQT